MNLMISAIGYAAFGALPPLLVAEALQPTVITRYLPLHILIIILLILPASLIGELGIESRRTHFVASACFILALVAVAIIGLPRLSVIMVGFIIVAAGVSGVILFSKTE